MDQYNPTRPRVNQSSPKLLAHQGIQTNSPIGGRTCEIIKEAARRPLNGRRAAFMTARREAYSSSSLPQPNPGLPASSVLDGVAAGAGTGTGGVGRGT